MVNQFEEKAMKKSVMGLIIIFIYCFFIQHSLAVVQPVEPVKPIEPIKPVKPVTDPDYEEE